MMQQAQLAQRLNQSKTSVESPEQGRVRVGKHHPDALDPSQDQQG